MFMISRLVSSIEIRRISVKIIEQSSEPFKLRAIDLTYANYAQFHSMVDRFHDKFPRRGIAEFQ